MTYIARNDRPRMTTKSPAGSGYDYGAEFLFGLDVVLDRLEQLLSAR
jgi:hypothetical protein